MEENAKKSSPFTPSNTSKNASPCRRRFGSGVFQSFPSHDNCRNGKGKDPELQLLVLDSVMSGIRRQREEYQLVRGFMLESFLKGGCQEIGPDMKRDGTSITDPCLSWDQTEQAIREIAEQHAAVR